MFGNRTEHRDPAGNTTTYTYDRHNRLLVETQPTLVESDGTTTVAFDEWFYDANGNITRHRNRLGGITDTTFNNQDQPTLVVRPDGSTRTQVFDDVANLTEIISVEAGDTSGRRVTYSYNLWDQIETETIHIRAVTNANGGSWPARTLTTVYTYDSLANPAGIDTPELAASTTNYDAAGRLVSATDAGGHTTTYTYNVRDQIVRVDHSGGAADVYGYDSAGRLETETRLGPDGTEVTSTGYTLDDNGQVLNESTAAGVSRAYTYDDRGLLIEARYDQVSPNVVATYGYDANANLAYQRDANNNVTTTASNAWGLAASLQEPSTPGQTSIASREFRWYYTPGGQTRASVEPGSVVVAHSYDTSGRLVREHDASNPTTVWREFDYNHSDELTAIRSYQSGETVFVYNDAGWLIETTGSNAAVFDYDNNGRLIHRQTASFNPAAHAFEWDDHNQLTRHTHDSIDANYTWNTAGDLERIDYAGVNAHRSFTYYANGQLHHDRWYQGTAQRSRRSYLYDDDANIRYEYVQQWGQGSSKHRYGYDNANRLVEFSIEEHVGSWPGTPQTVIAYGYDPVGNRTTETTTIDGTATTETFTYDNRNRLTNAAGTSYSWHPNGDLNFTNGGQKLSTWDAFGNLIVSRDTTSGFIQISYKYDALGRLTERTGGNPFVPAYFIYTGHQPEPTIQLNGTPFEQTTYGRSPSGNLATYQHSTANPRHIAAIDRYGDFMHLAQTSNGALIETRTWTPFGEPLHEWGNQPDPDLGHQTQYSDPQTGRTLMGSRWNNPTTGTFTSRDTYPGTTNMPVTLNRYTYAANNPTTYWDPTGYCIELWVEGCGSPADDDNVTFAAAQTQFNDAFAPDLVAANPSTGTSSYTYDFGITDADLILAYDLDHQSCQLVNHSSRCSETREVLAAAAMDYSVIDNPFLNSPDTLEYFGPPMATLIGPRGTITPSQLFRFAIFDYEACGVAGDANGWCALEIAAIIPFGKLSRAAKLGDAATALHHIENATGALDATRHIPAPSTAARACSFSGGTGVLMADGTTKPISEIEIGDGVLALDPETGQRAGRSVEHVFVHDDTVVDLSIGGMVVATTEDHPFWNQTDQAFQRADELDGGDSVLTADGSLVAVDGIVSGSARREAAHNLAVDEIHTYFVAVGDQEVLVHNQCGGLTPSGGFDGTPGSSPALTNNPWHPDAVSLRSASNAALYEDEVVTGFGVDSLVSDVLTTRLGSVTRAPLPPGSVGWDAWRQMTLGEIRAGANAGLPGYDAAWKLLNDGRFAR